MGVKKAKTTKSKTSKVSKSKSVVKAASSLGAKLLGGGSSASKGGGVRRSRQTPEKLAKKLLVIKLQKKIWKAKYGGR